MVTCRGERADNGFASLQLISHMTINKFLQNPMEFVILVALLLNKMNALLFLLMPRAVIFINVYQ